MRGFRLLRFYCTESQSPKYAIVVLQMGPNYMSLEGDWQGEFIRAVRNSISHTSDIDKLAHEALKNERKGPFTCGRTAWPTAQIS